MSVRCRLVRADGTKWHIKELREVAEGFHVDAVPNGASRPNGDGKASAGPNGGPARLEDEPLRRGDRIEWVEQGGEVLWAMRVPMDAAEDESDSAEEADAAGAF